jgi:Cu(I)/Ag(I) efflux system membrane fusion protein
MREGVGVRVAAAVRWALIAMLTVAAAGAWLRFAPSPAARVAAGAVQYRCPMHAVFVSERPGACGICGMNLVAVGAEPPKAPGPVAIAPERTQLAGVRTAVVTRQRLGTQLRATGFVAADESSVAVVTTRFSGWVDELRAQVGDRVEKGQPLAYVSGPELLTAQQVYLAGKEWTEKRNAQIQRTDAENNALQRLGIAQRDIDKVAGRGRPLRALPIRSPISGYVATRSSLPGLYVQPGAELFQIVDLSRVWVIAELHDDDVRRVQAGQPARFVTSATKDAFDGTIDLLYPAMDVSTRTLRARVKLPNPDLRLRPGMFGTVVIEVPTAEALTMPLDAVVDTGDTQYVLLARSGGRFEPRPVRLGATGEGRVQVVDGLEEGDTVVTPANFLIDSESRMRGALEAFGGNAANAALRADSAARR